MKEEMEQKEIEDEDWLPINTDRGDDDEPQWANKEGIRNDKQGIRKTQGETETALVI